MSQSLIEQFRNEDAANGYKPGQNVRPALEVASATSADQQARNMQLAEELGLSSEVVNEQRDWAEQESKARRIESNPVFARWATMNDTNAAFARDDTEKMDNLFYILRDGESKGVVQAMLRYNARNGDKAAQARLQAEFGMPEEQAKGTVSQTALPGRDTMDWGLLEAHLPDIVNPVQDVLGYGLQLGESFKEGWQSVAKNAAGFVALLAENMGKVVLTVNGQDMAPVWDKIARKAREALDYTETAHSAPLYAPGVGNDFVRNLPQIFAVAPVAAAGGAVAAGAFMGTQIAGGTYIDLTQKHDVRMPTAAELEEGARMLASASGQGWQGAVNNARIASHEAGGEGGELYAGNEPDELAIASARARMIAAAILNTPQSVPTGTAALASLGNALVQAPLEMVGFGKLFDVFKATGAGNLVRRVVESAATEFVTETIQQHPDEFSRIWGKGIAKGEGWQDVWKQYTGQFWDITKEGMYAGALAAPLGILGGIGKAATDTRMAREAVDWAQAHVAFHAKVEETKAKKVAPPLIKQALEEGGMHDVAHFDGEALYQLGQEDPLVLQQLGVEEKAVKQAAEAGQTISVPMSSVHSRMQAEQMPKLMAIARVTPDAWTAQEAKMLPEVLKQTAERATQEVARKTEEARQAEVEIVRIREEIMRAAASVPSIKAQVQSEGTSVEKYTDTHLELIVREARYLAENSGRTIADILREQTYEGLDYDATGKLTPVYKLRDAERMEEERARAEADRPFWELVWGRLDPESLKADYAETYKELRKGKRGLFMPAGRGGVPLDQIAAELNERGIFTGSADDLLELLKTKERPKRGYYQEDTEEQTEEAKRIAAEIDALAAGYERVLNNPLEGEADEVLASIGREDIEEAFDVLHGPAIEEGGEIIVQGKKLKAKTGSKGYGLVKIVFRHGEKGNKTPDMPIITKEDVLRLPELVREYAPAVNAETTTTWRIPRSDDLVLVIGTSREKDASRLVTMYVDKAGNLPLSEKRKPAAGSSGSKVDNTGDTAHGPTIPHESQEAGLEGSIKQNGEEVNSLYQRDIPENPLVTVHNLDGAALLFADSLGGLPAPSLGVTKADSAYSSFGDITLIGTRDMVDPATTPVFSNDAYTARFPAIDAERKPEGGLNLWRRLRQFALPEFSYFDRRLEHSLLDGEDDRKAVENKLLRAPAVMRAFLVENGMEVPDVRRPAEETAKHSMQPEVQAVVESLGPIERGWFDENSDTHKKVSEAYMAAERRINGQQEKPKSIFAKIFGPKEGLLPYEQAKRLVKAAEQDKNRIGKEELDDRATITNMRKIVDEHAIDYQAYLNSLLDVVFQESTVKVGKKKLPVTLENLVKAMTQNQLVRGEESSDIVSAGAVRAMASTRFNSMEELQANRSKVAAGEEVWPLERASNEAMADFRQLAAHEHATPSEAAAYNDVMTALAEAASKQPDKEALRQALQRHGVAKPSEEVLAAGMAALEQAQNILGESFEAKPQRAVQLSEFRGALVPDTVSDEVLAVLEKHGIPVQMYDAQQPASRQQAVRNMAYELAREDAGVLYQNEAKGRTVTRGQTIPAEHSGGMGDVVRLFYHANMSTLVHESAHVFFVQMKRLVDNGEANERMKSDYATLCKWVGSEDGHLTTAQHETLAKGMELFLREGKAPSKKLESAFARFRNWLLEVYKTVAGNPYFTEDGKQVELNPEVRNVFSRILATQEEVEAQAAADLMGQDYAAQLDALGVTGAQRVAITGLVMDAKNRAETDLHRRREADKRERMAKWRKEAAKEIEGERVYQARTALRARRGYGLDMLALANVVGNERALEFFRVLPGVKREGASPWEFAARFGYDSVEEFVNEVIAAPSKSARMAELMAAKEQEFDRQYKAESLIASEEAAQVAEQMEGHIIKAMGSKDRGVPLAQIRKAASDLLAGLPIDQAINAGKFRYQAKRLAMAMNEAILRQDFQRALDLNFKLRLNMELTREAQKRKDEFDALRKNLQKFTNSKEPNPVARYGVARLAMKFGLLSRSQMISRTEGDKDLNDVTGWIEEAKAAGYPLQYDAELWQADLPSWHAMNSGLFRRLYSQLNSMMTVERNMRHVEVQGRRIALDQYSGELAQHMLENDPNREELGFADDKSLVKATREFLDPLSTVNTRLKMYDGFQPLGMMWRAIMEPMSKAEANQIVFFKKYGKMLNDLIQKYYDRKQRVLMKDRVQIEGLPKPVSKEMCIMVGLNWGNAGNRLRLLNGFKNTQTMQKYGEREIMLMLEQLDENDWQFIQEVWDFFEQFKKESFDMEERLTGVRPLEVEATPVRTKFGTLRGGYFPIAYDPKRGAKAASQQVDGGRNVMMPSVFHGMMKDRTDEGLGTPLLLDFGVITDKLAETAHNLCYREPVIEVAKLLRSRAVSSAFAATEGPVVELKFWKWLSALAGEKPTRNSMDKIASWATSRMAIFAMGFKMTTMIAQASGLLATSTQLGRKWTWRGISETFNGGSISRIKDMWQDTCARSPMMMGRMNSFDRDVYAMSKKLFQAGHKNMALDLVKRTDAWLTEHAFTLTGLVQLWMVDIPTWRGAFAKAQEELGMSPEDAALYADDVVITAQGSGATKDMADIMREKGFMRVMTMFYSYFSAMYNMFYQQTVKTIRHPKEEWPYLASMAFVLWFVEPALTGLATGRGPDDDEEWHEWFLMNGVKQPFQMIPVLRDLSGAYFNHIEGKFGSDYRFTPAADVIGAFEKLLEHGEDLISGNNTKKAVKGLARDLGMISGTPFLSSQAITTVGNMFDWLDGTEEFALRDLFFTRKK